MVFSGDRGIPQTFDEMLTPLKPKTFPLLNPRQNAPLVYHGPNLFNMCPFPDSPALYV